MPPALLKPHALRPGAAIGIAAPAAAVDPETLAAGEERWRQAGFAVVRRGDLLARHRYLAGDDARRAAELMELVADPRVGAIVCARGGYGTPRILDRLDAAAVRAARKPLVGFSDVTALLLWQRRAAGLVGFHGPMLDRGGDLRDEELAALVAALGGGGPARPAWKGAAGGGGCAEGRLTGGSLTMVVASLGTPWEIDTRGALLLLEDVGERPYRLDRLLAQLRSAGKLARVAGIGLGRFERCDEPDGSVSAWEVLREVVEELGVPWVAGLPFGHGAPNLPWPVGARARLDGTRAELQFLERGVSDRP
ncbi:MAG: LD-carboxypeptidase [Deltaproteobacteria bacterium]|nr:LD-carboxypeptidase [Deltaproteobacteria bacterium]